MAEEIIETPSLFTEEEMTNEVVQGGRVPQVFDDEGRIDLGAGRVGDIQTGKVLFDTDFNFFEHYSSKEFNEYLLREGRNKKSSLANNEWWASIRKKASNTIGSEDDVAFKNKADIELEIASTLAANVEAFKGLPADQQQELLAKYPLMLPNGIPPTNEFLKQYYAGLDLGATYLTTGTTKSLHRMQKGQGLDLGTLLRGDTDPMPWMVAQAIQSEQYEDTIKGFSWSKSLGFTVSAGTEGLIDFIILRGAGKALQGTKAVKLAAGTDVYGKIAKTKHFNKIATVTGLTGTSLTTKGVGSFLNDNYSIEEVPIHTAMEVGGYLALSGLGTAGMRVWGGFKSKKAFAETFKEVTDKVLKNDFNGISAEVSMKYLNAVEYLQTVPKKNAAVNELLRKTKGTYNTLKSMMEFKEVPVAKVVDDVVEEVTPSGRALNVRKNVLDVEETPLLKRTAEMVTEALEGVIPKASLKHTEALADDILAGLTKDGTVSPEALKQLGKDALEFSKPETVLAYRKAVGKETSELHQDMLDLMAREFTEEEARDLPNMIARFVDVQENMTKYFEITGKVSQTLRSFKIKLDGTGNKEVTKSLLDATPEELSAWLKKQQFKMNNRGKGTPKQLTDEEAFKSSLKEMLKLSKKFNSALTAADSTGRRAGNVLSGLIRTGILSIYPERRAFEFVATMAHDLDKITKTFIEGSVMRFSRDSDVRVLSKFKFARLRAGRKAFASGLEAMNAPKVRQALKDGFLEAGPSGWLRAYGDNVNIVKHGGVEGTVNIDVLSVKGYFGDEATANFSKMVQKAGVPESGADKTASSLEFIWDNISDMGQGVSKNLPMLVDGLQDNFALLPAAMEGAEGLTFNLMKSKHLTQARAPQFHELATQLLTKELKGDGASVEATTILKQMMEISNMTTGHDSAFLVAGLKESAKTTKNTLATRTWKQSLTDPTRSKLVQHSGKFLENKDAVPVIWTEFVNPFIRSSANFLEWGAEKVNPITPIFKMIANRESPEIVAKEWAKVAVASTWLTGMHFLRQQGILKVAPELATRNDRQGLSPVTLTIGDQELDIRSTMPQAYSALKWYTAISEPFYNNWEARTDGEYTSEDDIALGNRMMTAGMKLAETALEPLLRNITYTYSGLSRPADEDYDEAIMLHLQSINHNFINYLTAPLFTDIDEESMRVFLSPSDLYRPSQVPRADLEKQVAMTDPGGVKTDDGWSDNRGLNLILNNVVGKTIKGRDEPYLKEAERVGANLIGSLPTETPDGTPLPREFYAQFNQKLIDLGYDDIMNRTLTAADTAYTSQGLKEHLETTSSSIRGKAASIVMANLGLYKEDTKAKLNKAKQKFKALQ